MIYFINKDSKEVLAQSFEDSNPIIPVKGDEITLKNNNWLVEECTLIYEDTKGTDSHVSYKNLHVFLKEVENG